MKSKLALLLTLSLGASVSCASTKLVDLRGPEAKTILIIPAKKYTPDKPLFVKIASEAGKAGLNVVRFNWAFVTNNTEPSKGLIDEAQQIDEIIERLVRDNGIEPSKLFVIAKSFGSRALMKSDFRTLQNVSLLTPNCDDSNTFNKTYGALFENDRNLNITISVDDPYCDIAQIYNFVDGRNSKVQVYTSTGDHNFDLQADPEQRNQMTAAKQLVNWVLMTKNQ